MRDPAVHAEVLHELLTWVADHGYAVKGLTASPLRGPAGNLEFLAHLVTQDVAVPSAGAQSTLSEAARCAIVEHALRESASVA